MYHTVSDTASTTYVHIYRNAAQQKNCTSPTRQKVAGAFFSRVIQLALLSLFPLAGLYCAYSCGFHSRTFTTVYITHSMSIAAPM